ncbi:xylose isomerase [Kitasatospora herbaricolor]|uniref:sugar phosphate isomerase/epimerase family protein n=1 Tax=Kitasatospora herbaricolor TaxID=68217 RepID=UPI00174BD990|nr:sugar phosphate isomerase/epimerase [Kitasatospora herbaricolor]MDQ0312246.1 sugar phosphate isomerase/epimerase [Kitasatospora herbaricolor]GGV14547.1 xylose isomerase [Kitasatospora herbaricolor]
MTAGPVPRPAAGRLAAAPGLAGLSLNTATTKRWTLPEAVDGCVRAGIPGIGLWRDRVAETGAAKAARLVREAGLTVTSLCRGGFLTAPDAAGRAAALEDNRRAVEEAATLGTGVLVLVCGGLPEGSRDLRGARRAVADALAELAPYAREHGVRLAIEPLHPMFCADRAVVSTLAQALDLAEAVEAGTGETGVGVVVDTYHVWWDPQVEEQIARAADRILAFQVCDWTLPLPADALLGRGHVGDGLIDIPRLAAAVAATGYTGFTEVEIFNQEIWDTPGDLTLRTLVERHRTHLARI